MVAFANKKLNVDDLPPMLRVQEAAWMASISVRTLWRLVSGRKFPPPIYIGRCARWRRADVEKWIADRCPSNPSDQQ